VAAQRAWRTVYAEAWARLRAPILT
jgi:hypothetical protein